MSKGDATMKFTELFSPPRVTAEMGTLPRMALVGGSTFDLRCDANGVAWDFRLKADRQRVARTDSAIATFLAGWEPAVHRLLRGAGPQPRTLWARRTSTATSGSDDLVGLCRGTLLAPAARTDLESLASALDAFGPLSAVNISDPSLIATSL